MNDGFSIGCYGLDEVLYAKMLDCTHGEGLAIITPRRMKHILSDRTVDRFVKYGVNVFGIDCKLDKFDIANKATDETYKFFESIGIPMHLKEECCIIYSANHANESGTHSGIASVIYPHNA